MEKRNVIIFDQATGGKTTWTNAEGKVLQIIYVVNYDDCELRRLFIDRDKFLELNVKGLFSKRTDQIKLLQVEIGIDEGGHEFVVDMIVNRFATFALDKPLD